jgi:hypothetical protein
VAHHQRSVKKRAKEVLPELVYIIVYPIASLSDFIHHQVFLLDFPAAIDIQIQ